jgi:hypothetical protein
MEMRLRPLNIEQKQEIDLNDKTRFQANYGTCDSPIPGVRRNATRQGRQRVPRGPISDLSTKQALRPTSWEERVAPEDIGDQTCSPTKSAVK